MHRPGIVKHIEHAVRVMKDRQPAGGFCRNDPLELDTDGDTPIDAEEVLPHGTSPLITDTDGDAQGDSGELAAGTDPLDAQSRFAAAMGDVAPGSSATV